MGQHTTCGYYATNVRSGLHELIKFINTEAPSPDLFDKVEEVFNDHHLIKYYAMSFPNPVSDREWHLSIMTKILNPETIVKVCVPCLIEEKERNVHTDRVRAEMRSIYKLTRISDSETRVEFYAQLEFGGHFPRWIINHELPKFMSAPTRWQIHFQHQRKLNQLDAEDGKIMGIMLLNKKKRESAEKRLEAFLSKNEALQQLKTTSFPQLDVMMLALLKNKLFHKKARGGNKVDVEPPNNRLTRLFRPTGSLTRLFRPTDSAVRTLSDLTEAEATKIGRSFALLLLTTTEPSAAVDAWKLDNKVLAPLFAEHAWFEPMINAIAKQLLKRSNLGLKWRVGLGAILSIGDIITDVSVIISYLDNGDTKQAYSLMGMMGLSISLQLVLAYVQNRKKSKWALIRELFIVLSGLKPAVDAYRIATGYSNEFSTFSPLADMSAGKGIELACESIPGESSEKMKIENDKNSRTQIGTQARFYRSTCT
jgi:hypothetical protein